MFLRYFVVIDRPFQEIERQFVEGPERWMPALAVEANGHGGRMLSELGFKLAGRRIGRCVELELGGPRRTEGVTLLPIKWRAASVSGIFPVLEGQFELARMGIATTQLGLSATYEPPFGLVGKIADRAMLHRVAEITVKEFVEQIAARLSKNA